jgi:glycosyltransferase involved in cell wall biosynthesis
MRGLYESDSLTAELRHKAVERVAEHYSWERVTDIYEELFERLVKSRSRETGV